MSRPAFFQSRTYVVACWCLFVLWFVTINILSSLPNPQAPPAFSFPHADKAVHFLMFFSGALVLATAWNAGKNSPRVSRFFWTFVLLAILGVLDEFRQLAIPGRSGADPGDMIANATGALAGAALACLIHLRHARVFFRN